MKRILCFLGFILWLAVSCTIIIPIWLMVYDIDWGDFGKQMMDGFSK